MIRGLTTANLGTPDPEKALVQHDGYVRVLSACGLDVTILEADERFPDSTFVEDTALVTPHCAIITNPGAQSRKGEVTAVRQALLGARPAVYDVEPPGTVDGGDIMMVGSHYYIGLSERTDRDGAGQVIAIIEGHGLEGSLINVGDCLHLKTGISYLENNTLAGWEELLSLPVFNGFRKLVIDEKDRYAANCLWVNGKVLLPLGYPKTLEKIEKAGYTAVPVDVSEFQKLDGGLSCLSLRF